MTFLKNDYSLNYSLSQHPDSSQSEVEYLKLKLIETHSKLIRELEYSKELEESARDWQHRYESTMAENESLVKKMNSLSIKLERDRNERVKQLESNLVQSEKKNDLLRIDLESMRSKILEYITLKQTVEDERRDHEQAVSKFNERLSLSNREIKQRETLIDELKQENQRYRSKYEKQISINKEIQSQISQLRHENSDHIRRIEEMEGTVRQEKDRQGKNMNELLMLQKEIKDWKGKVDQLNGELVQTKEENHSLKTRMKQEQRNLSSELEKLTNDYNNLQAMYRAKENELESARRRPQEDASRKKSKLEQTKELVGKMQKQQQMKMAARGSPSPRTKTKLSPRAVSRSYKEEKEEYLSMIESVGTMESQMLACNVQRKKILGEIDKIDETRVKTKEMISRRRRLQVQLQNQERRLQQIRNELKKMKVM